jgi:hypothetical protein
MAELFKKLNSPKGLTLEEAVEYKHCMQLHTDYVDSVQMLETKIVAAEIAKDTEWESELYIQLDSLECDPHRTRVK